MTSKKLPRPKEFGLTSFAHLLNDHKPIPGEQPGSSAGFRRALLKDLQPFTPYEIALAENLILIEWDIVQHRRMRDQVIRSKILDTIQATLIVQRETQHRTDTRAAREAWAAAGHEPGSFEADVFDQKAVYRAAKDLARRCLDPDPGIQEAAHAEVADLGIDLLALMGESYREASGAVTFHEDKLQEAERRRRGVRADLESLRRLRPIDGEASRVTDAEVLEP